jgi:transcriptional regulator with XRE-family HTH domain
MLDERSDSFEAVAARLKHIREVLGVNRSVTAARLGISVQAYSGYETASRYLTLETAKRLHRKHGISLDFIYFGNLGNLPHRFAVDWKN